MGVVSVIWKMHTGWVWLVSMITMGVVNVHGVCNVTDSSLCPQAMYERLFTWIVRRINNQLEVKVPKSGDSSVIGVLDIYGFEIFENNRYVQLQK